MKWKTLHVTEREPPRSLCLTAAVRHSIITELQLKSRLVSASPLSLLNKVATPECTFYAIIAGNKQFIFTIALLIASSTA